MNAKFELPILTDIDRMTMSLSTGMCHANTELISRSGTCIPHAFSLHMVNLLSMTWGFFVLLRVVCYGQWSTLRYDTAFPFLPTFI